MSRLVLIVFLASTSNAFAWSARMQQEQDQKIVRKLLLPEALDQTWLELTRTGDVQIHLVTKDRDLELGAYESSDLPHRGWGVSGGAEGLVPLFTDSQAALTEIHYVDVPGYRGAVARDEVDVLYAVVTHVRTERPRAAYFTLRRIGSVRPGWDWSHVDDADGVIRADGRHSLADLLRETATCRDLLAIKDLRHANVLPKP